MRPADNLTLHEVAAHLDVHYMTAYRYVRTGRLEAVKVGAGWQVSTEALAAFERDVETAATGDRVTLGAALNERLIKRLVVADEAGAWKLIEDALTSGHDLRSMYLDVLGPTMHEVGERWVAGDLTIADEHLASATMTRLLARLSLRTNRRGRKRGTVIVGAPVGDQHHLPSQFIADLLRGAGFQALSLGANTPVESFAQAATAHDDCLGIAISCSAPDSATRLNDVVAALGIAAPGIPVIVGGSGITEADADAAGSTGWAADALGLISWLDRRLEHDRGSRSSAS